MHVCSLPLLSHNPFRVQTQGGVRMHSRESSAASPSSLSPILSSSPPLILSPCAACKILRRRCASNCVLAPYFPPTDPLKFTTAHRVFGASNIIKLLQELPEPQRADAVSSMVYEADARLRDPVYGCAGSICRLQKQINELQAELAHAQAQILNMQCQNAELYEFICNKLLAPMNECQNMQLSVYNETPAYIFDESIAALLGSPVGAEDFH